MFCRGGGGEPTRCAQPGRGLVLPHPAEAEPGFPHVVRIRTDTFLCPEKCPRCRVRWGETGRSISFKAGLLLIRAARRPGSFAQGGRAPVRRRTRRFGHAALAPCSVFAPRRTTRRQGRVWLGWHRAAGRAKRGSRPAFLPRPARQHGGTTLRLHQKRCRVRGCMPPGGRKKAASLSEAQTAPPPAFIKNLSKS